MKVDWENVRPDEHNPEQESIKPEFKTPLEKLGEMFAPLFPELKNMKEGCGCPDELFEACYPTKPVEYMFTIMDYDVKYQLVDPTMPELKFATEGSVGLDLYNRQHEHIPPLAMGYKIPLNVKFKLPPHLWFMLACRSSFPIKWGGLIVANGFGVIDRDYQSEVCLLVNNFTSDIKIIPQGSRIAQAVFMPTIKFNLTKVELIEDNPDHAGFGSTG